MITRNNPDVGYMDESTFALLGFSQVVRADGTVTTPESPTATDLNGEVLM